MALRVADPDRPAFQLRPGEQGLSVFIPELVSPPLTEGEILSCFRAGSLIVSRSKEEIEGKGLEIHVIAGADPLPQRLRQAHAEIRAGRGMSRAQFKRALKELE